MRQLDEEITPEERLPDSSMREQVYSIYRYHSSDYTVIATLQYIPFIIDYL